MSAVTPTHASPGPRCALATGTFRRGASPSAIAMSNASARVALPQPNARALLLMARPSQLAFIGLVFLVGLVLAFWRGGSLELAVSLTAAALLVPAVVTSPSRSDAAPVNHAPESVAAPASATCEGSSLRMCASCGHVGRCESQAGHARSPARAAGHPVIMSMSIGQSFTWRYEEKRCVG